MSYPKLTLSFLLIALLVAFVSAQDEKNKPPVVATVNVIIPNSDPIYQEIRKASTLNDGFSSEFATVSNLVLKKDRATFTLASGEIYFLKPMQGRIVAAVFLGTGNFSLTPPNETEQKNLEIYTKKREISEGFSQLVMYFTDKTYEEIKSSASAKMGTGGSQAEKARNEFKEKESLLRRTFRFNMTSRTLADFYTPERPGFFTTFIQGNNFGKLIYQVDPLGIGEVQPEQVELLSYSESDGGIWTAFHMEDEYKKGTANSWTDRRLYDIKTHTLDTTMQGTRIVCKDEILLSMRAPNVKFLPFDLFGSLRVSSVKDEEGNAINFIQEKKEEDSDFGVILANPIEVGKPFKITVEYDGKDALREAGSGNFILIPRSTWYPNNPITSFGDRAAFELTFHYPKKFILVGVGSKISEDSSGDLKVSKWSSDGIEMAVAGFNYGTFKKQELADSTTGLNLEVYANTELPDEMKGLQQNIEQAERSGTSTGTTLASLNTVSGAGLVLNEAQNATRIYTAYFGKMPYKRIAMTQQPAGFFGQAWGTLVFMPYVAFFDDTQRAQLLGIRGGTNGFWREVAAHEVAHQWWGHEVGWTSYHDQWMSEGFAEFSTALYIQFVRKDLVKFNEFWENQRKQIIEATPATKGFKPFKVGPVTQGYRLNSAKTGSIARSMIYPKGAYILHMLRMMMYDRKGTGDGKFQAMMTDLLKSHYNQDISTNDFQKIVEKHMLPEMDIDHNKTMNWFFDEWVYGTEMPSYSMNYQLTKGADGKTMLSGKITQSGVTDNFVMNVPIYVDFGQGFVYLGSATIVGNTTLDLNGIALPASAQKVTIAAMHDILAEKIEVSGR